MKKSGIFTLLIFLICSFCACGEKNENGFNGEITVVSREEGSGTRDAFTALMEITDEKGNDITYAAAEITNSTSVAITTVKGDKRAIGYVSMGSLSDDVKTISVNGVKPDTENIKKGSYKLSRPFNICCREESLSDIAKDFESFIMSAQGQEIVKTEGYIPFESNTSYAAAGLGGKLSIAGSTSVAPVMEVLADEYKKLNPDVSIEIQQTGSSAGISSAIQGVCDFGMASRELNESERKALAQKEIALDAIAVIVNKENPTDNLSAENIRKIFTGETADWSEIIKVEQ